MKPTKVIAGLLGIFITMPIWYFLLYQVLVRVQASELMFFLFWIYGPLALLLAIIREVAGKE